MATEHKDYISKCDACLAHRHTPYKEPLLQHEFPDRPWSKVGIDLCEFQGHTLSVMLIIIVILWKWNISLKQLQMG